MCLFFKKRIYACKCNKVFFSKSENKINRLQQKHGGPSLLFVISSLESPLPLHKKKGSVQSTLFFMSNARQMWLAFGDSRCSPCASAAFCLSSILQYTSASAVQNMPVWNNSLAAAYSFIDLQSQRAPLFLANPDLQLWKRAIRFFPFLKLY